MREVLSVSANQMDDWKAICEAYAKKHDGKVVFVNNTSCGIEFKSGTFKHIYIDEMAELLKRTI